MIYYLSKSTELSTYFFIAIKLINIHANPSSWILLHPTEGLAPLSKPQYTVIKEQKASHPFHRPS
jgi:hypothetical protein